MDEEVDVAAVEIVEPLAAAFAMALNTTFQVLVSRNVLSNGEAKALLKAMADTLRQGHGGNPSSVGGLRGPAHQSLSEARPSRWRSFTPAS